jgi:hypothetical protein
MFPVLGGRSGQSQWHEEQAIRIGEESTKGSPEKKPMDKVCIKVRGHPMKSWAATGSGMQYYNILIVIYSVVRLCGTILAGGLIVCLHHAGLVQVHPRRYAIANHLRRLFMVCSMMNGDRCNKGTSSIRNLTHHPPLNAKNDFGTARIRCSMHLPIHRISGLCLHRISVQ